MIDLKFKAVFGVLQADRMTKIKWTLIVLELLLHLKNPVTMQIIFRICLKTFIKYTKIQI